MNHLELINVTNNMHGLLTKYNPTREDMVEAAHIGCRTLRILADDVSFFANALKLKEFEQRYKSELDYLVNDFHYFLTLERDLLLRGGLRKELVNALFSQAEKLLKEVRQGTYSMNVLRGTIVALRQKTCSLHEKLQTQEERQRLHARLRGVAYGLGGAVIITMNSSPMAIAPLGYAGMALSGALGSNFLAKGWDLTVE
ncbi:MAG: hypothetical protein CL608_04675 [Anaerolineaceae bacterium]|nr:hypothetical protein [Anaerolineaceae bacterium]